MSASPANTSCTSSRISTPLDVCQCPMKKCKCATTIPWNASADEQLSLHALAKMDLGRTTRFGPDDINDIKKSVVKVIRQDRDTLNRHFVNSLKNFVEDEDKDLEDRMKIAYFCKQVVPFDLLTEMEQKGKVRFEGRKFLGFVSGTPGLNSVPHRAQEGTQLDLNAPGNDSQQMAVQAPGNPAPQVNQPQEAPQQRGTKRGPDANNADEVAPRRNRGVELVGTFKREHAEAKPLVIRGPREMIPQAPPARPELSAYHCLYVLHRMFVNLESTNTILQKYIDQVGGALNKDQADLNKKVVCLSGLFFKLKMTLNTASTQGRNLEDMDCYAVDVNLKKFLNLLKNVVASFVLYDEKFEELQREIQEEIDRLDGTEVLKDNEMPQNFGFIFSDYLKFS